MKTSKELLNTNTFLMAKRSCFATKADGGELFMMKPKKDFTGSR